MTPWTAVLADDALRPGAVTDAVDGVVPAWVLTPPDVDGVVRMVATACDEGLAIVASGHGRHLDMAAPPRALDAVVRLTRLERIVAHEAADMTVTAQAGCTLTALDRTLAAAGQWLPLDPPCPDETTVGGLIAANLSGPLRALHGTVRDSLIGITVVGANGAVVRGGGRVVKNVAGYDLPKLHVGAFGSAGVIVEATFKVKPRPACEQACVFEVASLAAAFDLALAVRDAAPVSWIEVAHGMDAGVSARLSVGITGSGAWVEAAVTRVAKVAAPLEVTRVASGAELRARHAEMRARPAAAIVRVATLPTQLGPLLERVAGASGPLPLVASAASGVAHIAVTSPAATVSLVRTLRERAPEGSVVVLERGIAEVKRSVDVWGDVGAAIHLMRGVKQAFDPAGVFAPGRFVAGL